MGFKIAVFSLNQWALDFEGNTDRIIESIDQSCKVGAVYRAGPELELCGYSVEDAYFESDTVYHSWKCLMRIIEHSSRMDMVVDVGMPVHNTALYNCRVIVYMGKVLCIRAKTSLANDGNYREGRYFTPWSRDTGVCAYRLPAFVAEKLKQEYVPFGSNFILELAQPNYREPLKIGWDICQELWDVKNTSSDLYYRFGCHVIFNGSGSYWELRKLSTVLDMVKGISLRGGACYAFSNSVGCDGQRYVFYGRSCIYDKGNLVAMTPTDCEIFKEIQMIEHTVSPSAINEYRARMRIKTDISCQKTKVWNLSKPPLDPSLIDDSYNRLFLQLSNSRETRLQQLIVPKTAIRFEQEIHLYVSLWLWDYLRRSRMVGFMMPLSGGLDSSTVAILVYSMCTHIHSKLSESSVQRYFNQVHKIELENLKKELDSPEAICGKLLKCCYLSTKYSSPATFRRASTLSRAIGATFSDLSIQDIYSNFRNILTNTDQNEVSLLDQNLQARLRMTATYYLSGGNRIVLATGNVDEGIMGYLTKYDCSSADINPIGGLCKDDLKSYLRYCCVELLRDKSVLTHILEDILEAPPSAELTGAEQRDEDEMGVTYDEISVLGKVRRGTYGCCGPKGAFETIWNNRFNSPFCDKVRCLIPIKSGKFDPGLAATELSSLVKRFYQRYARNRHKLTVLTPALHSETYSPDDNRFDHRHFLYAPWTEQFKCIDEMVEEIKQSSQT